MKKAICLTMMIAVLTAGSITAYAAAERPAGTCTQNSDCTIHEACRAAGVCNYEGCRYGNAGGCYEEHGNHENYRDCEYYIEHNNHMENGQKHHTDGGTRHHGGTGQRHGRGNC